MKLKLHVISFGQSGYYFDIAQDFLSRFRSIYKESSIYCYSEHDLPVEIINYSKIHKRGYGYWQWKPYIILKELNKMNNGDILLYADGRSHVIRKNADIHWLEEFLNSRFDIVLHNGFAEGNYTTQKVLEYFEVVNDSYITKSKQYFAGLLLMKKSEEIVKLIQTWYEVITTNAELFRDDDNNDPNNINDFVENRHDQSALSILLKKNQNLEIGSFSDLSNTNIVTHFKFKKGRYSKLFNFTRMVIPGGLFIKSYNLFRKIKLLINK